jgi:glycosyltransferase involved in cell wall biosynthesis
LRILVLCYEYPPVGGGTAVACEHVVDELAVRGGLEIDVVTSTAGPERVVDRPAPGVEVYRLPVGKRELHYWRPDELAHWTYRALRLSRWLVGERRHDLAHCWAGWPSGIIGYLLRSRLPYLVSLRGSDVPGYNARLRLLDPLVFRHLVRRVWSEARDVIAVSDSLRELARKTSSSTRIEVIRNGVDLERFRPAHAEGGPGDGTDRPFTVLFVGRLVERKGVGLLARAFAGLARDHADARLVVAGDGPGRDALRAILRRDGLVDRADLLGVVARADLPALYRSASVLALPAFEDALPNAVLEAMASGLPIVTTPTGARELVSDNGILVEIGSAEDIERALRTYRDDPERRRRDGRRSREIAETMSWAEVARRYRSLYDALAGRDRNADRTKMTQRGSSGPTAAA